jgi:hypothetical protein
MNRSGLFPRGALGLVLLLAGGVAMATASSAPSGPAGSPTSAPRIATAPVAQPNLGPGATPSSEPAASSPATPLPTPTPTPTRPPDPPAGLDPPPTAGPFAMDLYHPGDFVSEQEKIWCAAAATLTMVNVMSPGADRTAATQRQIQLLGRKLGPAPDLGLEPEGMAKALDRLGFGRYEVTSERTIPRAVKAAARAIRLTGRPAALLVWRGAHAWVMSGFRATADPALTDDFQVTHVRIEDVWWPRVSTIWGESRSPDALVPVRLLPEDYLPWKRPTGRYPGKDGRFVLVVPVGGG